MRMRTGPKHGRSYFGYKNHVNADVAHGFIRAYAVTPASVHDSQRISALLDVSSRQKGRPLYGDSAYRSAETTQTLSAPWPRGSHALQGASQPAADGATGRLEHAAIQGAGARGARVRAHRPVPPRQTPALHRDWNAPRCAWG